MILSKGDGTAKKSGKIKDISSYIIIAFIFAIPVSTSLADILAVLIILLWLADGNFKEKFTEIGQNRVALAILVYLALHLFGLLWTEDLAWGLYTLKKQWKLLLMPVVMSMVKKEHVEYYLSAFIAAMLLSMLLSYMIWFGLITMKSDSGSPVPFMAHVVYTPFMAFTAYLLLARMTLARDPLSARVTMGLISCLACFNIFITSGRIGQLAFAALMLLLGLQYFQKTHNRKAALIFCMVPCLLFAAYATMPIFKDRVDSTCRQLTNFDGHGHDSVTERLTFMINSMEIIKKYPILGVGTGDFPSEYRKNEVIISPSALGPIENPHNQYLLTTGQFGAMGLITLLAIFYLQIAKARSSIDYLSSVRLALPIFYLVIFLGDSYLQTSATSLLFASFSGILFKDFSHHT